MGAGGFFAAGGAAAGGTASAGTATLASTLSSVASGAVAGAKAALMSTFTTHLINERANLGNVGRKMASKDTAKSVGFGGLTGGLMAGAEHVSGINTTQMQGFRQQVQGNAVKFAVNSGVRMAFGEKPKDVFKSGAANFAADVVAGLASNEISDWRQRTIGNGSLFDYTLHKGLHFATGAATRGGAEALMGGNSSAIHQAALSGGMGAATAEILGEKLALDALRSGRMHEGNTAEMMGHITSLSSQTAGLGAALTGLDVSHAQHAGSVAVENNLGPLVVALAAMKGKDIYDTTDGAIAAYQEDGAEGLVEFGVDEGVGMLMAGTAMKGAKVVGKGAKKALDAVEDMLPDAVTKAVGKAANSAGGVLKEATAVLDSAKGKAKTTVKSVFGLRGGKVSSGNLKNDVELQSSSAIPSKKDVVTREKRWVQLAEDPNSVLPKEVKNHVLKSKGKGVSRVFGLELAHKPKKSASAGYDYAETLPKTTADHRGLEHRFLKERRTGTVISKPKTSRERNKYSLPKPGKLPK